MKSHTEESDIIQQIQAELESSGSTELEQKETKLLTRLHHGLDVKRSEVPWDDDQETLLTGWANIAAQRSANHNSLGKKNKLYYRIFASFATIIPITVSTLLNWFDEHSLVVGIGILITGICTGVISVFRFDALMNAHYDFSAKYEDFKRQVVSLLAIPRKYRTPCDVAIKEYELKLNGLSRHAPDL